MLPWDRFAAYPESQNQNTVNIPISAVSSIPPFALDSNFTSKAIAFVSWLCFYFCWPSFEYLFLEIITLLYRCETRRQCKHTAAACAWTEGQAVTSHRKNWKDLMWFGHWSGCTLVIYLVVCRHKSKGCALCDDSQLRYYGNEIWIMVLGRLVVFNYPVDFEKQSLLISKPMILKWPLT